MTDLSGSPHDSVPPTELGVLLANGCRIVHGAAERIKRPFNAIPVVMYELDAGVSRTGGRAFSGQFGCIQFDAELRLPRHVHVERGNGLATSRCVAERTLVVNGVGLAELAGEIYLVAPGSLVDVGPGVPHTWTACPAGMALPDGTVSTGEFLMIYEYAAPTGFFPLESTSVLGEVSDYREYSGDLETIIFPRLTLAEIAAQASLVWNSDVRNDLRPAS